MRTPLAERDTYAVSARAILATGRMHAGGSAGNLNVIDLRQERASGVAALNEVSAVALHQARQNPYMIELLRKERWTAEDREAYEVRLNDIVGQAFANHPLLNHVRQERDESGRRSVLGRGHNARDLTHLTEAHELDCDGHSMLRAITLQRVEDQLLPRHSPDPYRRATDYQVAAGWLLGHLPDSRPSRHAAILSPASGNMIEATAIEYGYLRSNFRFSFADFVAGLPFHGRPLYVDDEQIYTHPDASITQTFGTTLPSLADINARRAAFAQGERTNLQQRRVAWAPTEESILNGFHLGIEMLRSRNVAQEALINNNRAESEVTLNPIQMNRSQEYRQR